MTVRLAFHGFGSADASEAQVQAMLDLASQVFAELWRVGEAETRYVMPCKTPWSGAVQGQAMRRSDRSLQGRRRSSLA